MLANTQWAIIADDLTGACDAGAAFAKRGFGTVVVLDFKLATVPDAPILAITTNSRHDPPRVAARKVRAVCRRLRQLGIRIIYKKMDSTLKGNVGVEVEAAMKMGGFSRAIVCPANPAQGRIIRQGILFMRGKRARAVADCFADESVINDNLLSHMRQKVALSSLKWMGTVPSPASPVRIQSALVQSARIIIADARQPRDLTNLVRAAWCHKPSVLLAGSAGMANSLAEFIRVRRESQKSSSRLPMRDRVTGGTLLFIGSLNPVMIRQIKSLIRHRQALSVSLARVTPKLMEWNLSRGRAVVVTVPIHRKPPAWIRSRLNSLRSAVNGESVTGLILSGGDTALAVCRWLRVRAIALEGEVVPGLAFGKCLGGRAAGLRICTKPGGFGATTDLVMVVDSFGASFS